MKKVRIEYNKNTCIGCGACQIACKEQNGLMEGEFKRLVTFCTRETGTGKVLYPYSFSCNHCNNPKCTAVCPTGAMHKTKEGTVLHDDSLCIACGRCYWACPFGEVSISRRTGMTQKCDNCLQRRKDGKLPKCVSFCSTGSLRLVEEEVPDEVEEVPEEMTGDGRIYLILGGGAAALYAAKAVREEDCRGRIIIISDDRHRPYRRPMLSKMPFRTFKGSELELFSPDWFAENHVNLHLEEKVISINTEEKTVLSDKGTYSYDKCIYALGASAFIPPFPGREKKGVYAVRTIEDIEGIKHTCLEGNEAVIIGGGVIGIEFALQLREYGMDVTILEAMPRLMARQLDEDMSQRLLEKLRKTGFRVETGVNIKEITGTDRVSGVALADGRVFPASLVIVSCGVRANTKIALDAGIICPRAVQVNRYMETNVSDVYACGDVAQLDGVNYALWSQAMVEGDTAGRNAAGRHIEAGEFDTSLIINSREINMFSLGDTGLDSEKNYKEITALRDELGFRINDRERTSFSKLVYLEGKLTGVAILGNLWEMEKLRGYMESEK